MFRQEGLRGLLAQADVETLVPESADVDVPRGMGDSRSFHVGRLALLVSADLTPRTLCQRRGLSSKRSSGSTRQGTRCASACLAHHTFDSSPSMPEQTPPESACTERRDLSGEAGKARSRKWTRAESNRRPGVVQRSLSYACSRRFISASGLPSTGFRRPFQHFLLTFTPS